MKQIISIILALYVFTLSAIPASAAFTIPQDTNVYNYMDYNYITDTTTNQWKLQQECFTNPCGLRCYIDYFGEVYYVVAMSNYYGTTIGDAYEVTLNNNNSFKVILGDCKAPKDTTNKYGTQSWNFIDNKYCTNVIEFIVDESNLPDKILDWGTLTAIEYFNENIQEIEYIGKKW